MEQTIIRGDYKKLEEYLLCAGLKRPFLVCGKSAEKFAIYKLLEQSGTVKFTNFHPNPNYSEAEQATELFQLSDCDCIVGLGGGSAMDVAKCTRLWSGRELPLIAIPTTAGTGSEATYFAVVYKDGEKQSVADERCLPDVVLLDPTTLETLPEYHRKSSMLDALCHAVESFWSKKATPESREFSRQAIAKILYHMESYLENRPSGNAGMLEAAYLAGKAINLTTTTAGHAMCYKLTTIYGIVHGHAAALCCAKLWPYMIEKAPCLDAPFTELAEAFGCASASEAAEKFQNIMKSLELSVPAPVPEDYDIFCGSVNAERLANNPVPLSREEIDRLYHQILGGEES